jgi:UDP-N-acetyl-D-glucosamine dehydrogenase
LQLRSTADLRRRILTRKASIAVVGQGYVGLSLACAAAEAGFDVVAIDVDQQRLKALSQGRSVVPGVPEDVFGSAYASRRISFTPHATAIANARLIFICVPTPLRDGTPDLSHIDDASRDVAEHMTPGCLVVLESTTYPGTTEERVLPVLEEGGMRVGRDFLLAYSPERIDPGSSEYSFREVPRVVGGINPEATGLASLFYEQIVDKVVPVSSCKAAELAKLLENTFRHVNIALVNEMATVCNEVGIDVWEVIDAAATKPFGFMPFHPGPGVGGHCIPLDPTYLTWQVRRDSGHQFRVVDVAEDINAQMPGWVAGRIADALNEHGKAVKGAKILVLGAAYKPDVGDVRESPSVRIMRQLHRRGGLVSFHDPFVESVQLGAMWLHRSPLTTHDVMTADIVAVLTPHADYDMEWVADHARLVFDARNAVGGRRRNVVKL